MWKRRIHVAGVSTLEEALFCRSAGVDALGFTLGLPGGPHDGLTPEMAGRIIEKLPNDIESLVITYLTSADDACNLVRKTGADSVQFHGGISKRDLEKFRKICSGTATIGRITVTGSDATARLKDFSPEFWDAIILDSHDPGSGRIGATGLIHDWEISAGIVEASPVPIILAGGLNAGNVVEAVQRVKPYGVDAHTGVEDADGTRNYEKIRLFAENARAGFLKIGIVL